MKKKLKDPSELKRMNLIKYQAIVMKFIQNLSETDISKGLNVHFSQIKAWINKFEKYGDLNVKVPKKTKTKVLTEEMKEKIKQEYEINPIIQVKDIVPKLNSDFNTKISKFPVYKYLRSIGKFIRPQEKTVLNEKCKLQRRIYCQKINSIISKHNFH